jgi:N-acetylmuramoyl-L-alanine amidase
MPDTTASPDATAAASAPNPYDTTQYQPPQPQGNPMGIFGGPSNANAPSILGGTTGFWNGMANWGANTIGASNQRTSFGTLANPGVIGALGVGLQQTMAQGRAANAQQAQIAHENAQTEGENWKNRLAALQAPSQQAEADYMTQVWKNLLLRQQQGQVQATPAPTATTQPPAVGGPFVAQNLPAWVTPEEDSVVRTVWGEARGEPPEGQQAVASVIQNRADQSGTSRSDVVFAPGQFEPWNDARTRPALEKLDPNSAEYQKIFTNIQPILAGTGKDVTNGSTYFYSPTAQAALGRDTPTWAQGQTPSVVIGNHQFYKLPYAPPTDVAKQPPAAPVAGASPASTPPAKQATAEPAPAPAQVGPQQNQIAARLAAGDNPAGLSAPPQRVASAQPQPQSRQQVNAGPVIAAQNSGAPPTQLPFKPYQVAGEMQPPPASSLSPDASPPGRQYAGDLGGPGTYQGPAAAPRVAQAAPPTQLAPQTPSATQPGAKAAAPPNPVDTLVVAKQFEDQRDRLMAQAAQLEQAQKMWTNQATMLQAHGAPMTESYPAGDPAGMRTQADAYNTKAIELRASVPLAVAQAANQNQEARSDALLRVTHSDGSQEWVRGPHYTEETLQNDTVIMGKTYPALTKIGGYTYPPQQGSPPGTQGEFVPSIDAKSGGPVVISGSPGATKFQEATGEELAKEQHEIRVEAADAQDQNYLFDSIRQASQGWSQDRFADWKADAKQYISAIGHQIGINTTNIDASLGNYTTMTKDLGQLTRSALEAVQGRAARYYDIVSDSLMKPTTVREAVDQITDQWQGLNDYKIAKLAFQTQYQGDPKNMEFDFLKTVDPEMFALHRMQMRDPAATQALFANLQKTPAGQAFAKHLGERMEAAQKLGLFNNLPGMPEPPALGATQQ